MYIELPHALLAQFRNYTDMKKGKTYKKKFIDMLIFHFCYRFFKRIEIIYRIGIAYKYLIIEEHF